MINVAYGSVPKDGGTFTCYRNLRPYLLDHGVDMRCVSVGRDQYLLWEDSYSDEGCVALATRIRGIKKQAVAFSKWCESESIDIVMGVNSPAILSAIPHLPQNVRVVARCANAFEHGYRITMSGHERLAAIIATTPRLERDLLNNYGADPAILHLIPNGIDTGLYERAANRPRPVGEVLQIGFLGRLEHNQKGVMHIPPIVRELRERGVAFRLRIAGKGKHRGNLEAELNKEADGDQVEFLGSLNPKEVPAFLASIDVFLFTSHFEGCPNALLEAMMAGCVPVSSRIEGITDYIVRHGETGYLNESGDYSSIADAIECLAENGRILRAMSRSAASDAGARFSANVSASTYTNLFKAVVSAPAPIWQPLPWREFRPDPNFDWSWKQHIPEAVKAPLRRLAR